MERSRGGTQGGLAAWWPRVDAVPGWLSADQARVLHEGARRARARGLGIVEIGSHHGRSTAVLALAGGLPDAPVVAVDPFPADWRYGSAGTEAACRRTLRELGVDDRVDLRVATSAAVLGGWQAPLGFVYVDGKHDARSAQHDLRWHRHVAPGGWVAVHDAFSSLGVTLGLLGVLATARRLRYLGRVGSLAVLEVARPSPVDRVRPLRELPWWGRNLVVKVLLRLRLAPLARLLGHRGPDDPF